MNNYNLIYKHRHAQLHLDAGLIHPSRERERDSGNRERERPLPPRRGSAVRGGSEERAGLAGSRTTRFHRQTAAALEPRLLPKTGLCQPPPGAITGPGFFPLPSAEAARGHPQPRAAAQTGRFLHWV